MPEKWKIRNGYSSQQLLLIFEEQHTWLANTRALVSATFREFLDKQKSIHNIVSKYFYKLFNSNTIEMRNW